MREIVAQTITSQVADAIRQAHYHIRPDVQAALEQALRQEVSPLGRQALTILLENAQTASAQVLPLCQDTGLTIIFVEKGTEVCLSGAAWQEALTTAVRQATLTGHLRRSVTRHPLTRGNSGDNTPPIIHFTEVPGDHLKIHILIKGAGCENASALAMLPPAAGQQGVSDFIVNTIRKTGAMACPPLIVGVGIGGNFELAPFLAKRALLRKISEPSSDPVLAKLETKLLGRINALGLGPQGWGGSCTALSVAIEASPCHIASLPVAVNVECHSHRLAEVVL